MYIMEELEFDIKDIKFDLPELEFNIEDSKFELHELNLDSSLLDLDISKMSHEELKDYCKKLDMLMERRSKDLAIERVLNRESPTKQKEAIRALAKYLWIHIKRTKKRRFCWKTELVTPEEKEAFKTILDMEWIDIPDDILEELFE